ncbi:adenine methyltransferase [Pasteurellaceae bacterium Macca]|nr:adenine methyltransferase [Pasteurellaceae bacterium Macca]MCK3656194.1 adenine methyltransferase [Pasteurellaceae bacterium Macca]MCK3656210.1 adenine methyltransferase [Pasteurellaceae bacterium Macca]MCK3656637.1 adenine methyltransferase [Pasteurellaceae bacterium Macca]
MQQPEFDKDTYRTPAYFTYWAKKAFGVNVDGCATETNAICSLYIGKESEIGEDFLADFRMDYLLADLCGEEPKFWVNPPYSNPLPFVKRAAELKAQGYLVVMLLPADKSTKWYRVIKEHATAVIDIIGGRINFVHPVTGKEAKGNNKGSMVAVFDPNMQGFVTRQVELGFIKEKGLSK